MNILTFGDFATNLWHTFLSIAKGSDRIDIVFDLYLKYNIKSCERQRRADTDGIITIINRNDQPLPVEMKSFWALSENKESFQHFFIKWTIENNEIRKPLYLGGCHPGDSFKCILLTEQECKDVEPLRCYHEEADDRVFFHINQAIMTDRVTKVNVARVDTDILVNLAYHFTHWNQCNLSELWMICGKNEKVPLHNIIHTLNRNVLDVLPAIHALTGCDTTSKVGAKKEALNVAVNEYHNLVSFGKDKISEEMIKNAEQYLVSCLSKSKEETFNAVRFNRYHMKTFKMEFDKLPCTSESIYRHIARAYLQCYRWINCPFEKNILLDPLKFGYIMSDDNEDLIPDILVKPTAPPDFPVPCGCGKCARQTICPCRIKKIACCQFCNCCASTDCKNPVNHQ